MCRSIRASSFKTSPGGKLAICNDSRHCDVLFSKRSDYACRMGCPDAQYSPEMDSNGQTLCSIYYTYSCPSDQLVLEFENFTMGPV